MTPELLAWLRTIAKPHVEALRPAKVLELGSYNVNGSARDALQEPYMEWIGVDYAAGPGVDVVMDAEDYLLTQNPASTDMIVCCEMLEHTPNPLLIVDLCHEVLVPGGLFIITQPGFHFPNHASAHYDDYWRISPSGMEKIYFKGMELLAPIVQQDDGQSGIRKCSVAGIARKMSGLTTPQ